MAEAVENCFLNYLIADRVIHWIKKIKMNIYIYITVLLANIYFHIALHTLAGWIPVSFIVLKRFKMRKGSKETIQTNENAEATMV